MNITLSFSTFIIKFDTFSYSTSGAPFTVESSTSCKYTFFILYFHQIKKHIIIFHSGTSCCCHTVGFVSDFYRRLYVSFFYNLSYCHFSINLICKWKSWNNGFGCMCNQGKLILFFVSSSCWNTNPKSWTVWIYRVPIFLMNVVCNKSQRPFCDSVVQGFIFH